MSLPARTVGALTMPKKVKLTKGEEIYLTRLAQKTGVPATVIWEIAKRERVPVTSILILGGRPYIDVSGLDRKTRNKADDEKLIIKEITAELIIPASAENDHLARAKGIVKYFDKINFNNAIAKADTSAFTEALIARLEGIYTEIYTDEGWASPEDCAAIAFTYKKVGSNQPKVRDKLLPSNINMMACRRASSRAKRAATGCGLTSLDEVPMTDEHITKEVLDQRKATKKQFNQIDELKQDKHIRKSELKLIEQRIDQIKEDRTDKKLTEGDADEIIRGIELIINTRKEPEKNTEKEKKDNG